MKAVSVSGDVDPDPTLHQGHLPRLGSSDARAVTSLVRKIQKTRGVHSVYEQTSLPVTSSIPVVLFDCENKKKNKTKLIPDITNSWSKM